DEAEVAAGPRAPEVFGHRADAVGAVAVVGLLEGGAGGGGVDFARPRGGGRVVVSAGLRAGKAVAPGEEAGLAGAGRGRGGGGGLVPQVEVEKEAGLGLDVVLGPVGVLAVHEPVVADLFRELDAEGLRGLEAAEEVGRGGEDVGAGDEGGAGAALAQ